MATRCLILAATLLASSLTTTMVAAGPDDGDRATARALAYEGHDALLNKDYATAADRFARADALVHAPTLLLGLARAEVGLGKLTAAQEHYNRIVREGVPRGAPPVFTQAVADARREVKKLAARIPSVIITVKGPSAPDVTLDGAPLPAAALGEKHPVDPGAHMIRASANGFEARTVSITLTEGKQESVTVELKPTAQAESSPPEPSPSPAAASAPPGPVTRPAGTSEAVGSTQKTLGIIGLSLGGVGFGLGGATGVLAIVQRNSFKSRCAGYDCPADLAATISTYRTLGALSTAGFIVGGAGVVAGTILLLTAPKAKGRAEASVTPLVGAGFLGVAGAF
jgi:hypothetical protein